MSKEIATWGQKHITWNAKQIVKMIDNNTARFDSAYQRTYVWDLERKSMMIHSMIMQIPTEPLWAAHGTETRVYDFMDGKQRCNAIRDYIKGTYALKDVPPIQYRDVKTGNLLDDEDDVNGKFFSELSEEMQDNILSYQFSVNYFDDIDEESQEDFFVRINRGKVLSAIELSRVKCASLPDIQKLTYHPLFDFISEKARKRYTDEDIIVKCFAMVKMDIPCLDTKAIRPFMETLEISKDEYSKMQDVFTTIKTMHDEMEENEAGAVAKRLYVKTHLISIIPFVMEHGKQTKFLQKFFSGERMSISQKYNDNATAGVGHAPAVKARLDAIETEWRKFK